MHRAEAVGHTRHAHVGEDKMCGGGLADVAKTLSDGMVEDRALHPCERYVAVDGITNPTRGGELRHPTIVPARSDAQRSAGLPLRDASRRQCRSQRRRREDLAVRSRVGPRRSSL
jgi:hypothetical protein